MKSIIDWTYDEGGIASDSLRKLFSAFSADELKSFVGNMESLHFKILAPQLANTATIRYRDEESERAIQAHENYLNGSDSIVQEFDVVIHRDSPISAEALDILIPKVPLYCDCSSVPLSVFDVESTTNNKRNRAQVAPHYVWSQPYLHAGKDVGAFELGENPSLRQMSSFNNMMSQGESLSLFAAFKDGVSTSGFVTHNPFTAIESNLEDESGLVITENSPVVYLVSGKDIEYHRENYAGLDGGYLYYEDVDYFEIKIPSRSNLVIRYRAIPITSLVKTSQAVSGEKFNHRVSGHQAIALTPIAVGTVGQEDDGVYSQGTIKHTEDLDYTVYTYNTVLEYPLRTTSFEKQLNGSYHAIESYVNLSHMPPHEIDKDNVSSLYVATMQQQIGQANDFRHEAVFGIRRIKDKSVNYPINHSPVLRTERTYCGTPEEFSETFRVEWVKKITDTPATIEYLVKILILQEKNFVYPEDYEYSPDCGYTLILVSGKTIDSMTAGYSATPTLGDRLLVDTFIVKESGLVSCCELNKLNVSDSRKEATFSTEGGFGSIEILDSSERNNTLPAHSFSSLVNTFTGTDNYIGKAETFDSMFWDGKPHITFTPNTASEGHGEAKLSTMSHYLDKTSFPILLPTMAMWSPLRRVRDITARGWWTTTGMTPNNSMSIIPNYNGNLDDSSPSVMKGLSYTGQPAVTNQRFSLYRERRSLMLTHLKQSPLDVHLAEAEHVAPYSWFLNYLRAPAEGHLHAHGIDYLSIIDRESLLIRGGIDGLLARNKLSNTFMSDRDDNGNTRLHYQAGCINFYNTPVIGEGGIPVEADFAITAVGADFTREGLLAAQSDGVFNSQSLLHVNDGVYKATSYNMMTSYANVYEVFKGLRVTKFYTLGNIAFIGNEEQTSVWVNIENAVNKLATIKGELVEYPIQDLKAHVLATLSSGECTVCHLTEDGLIHVFRCTAGQASMSYDREGTPMLTTLDNNGVKIYDLSLGGIIDRSLVQEISAQSIHTLQKGKYPYTVIQSEGVSYQAKPSDEAVELEITSSDQLFRYLETQRLYLFGIKVVFDNSDSENNETFDCTIVINNDSSNAIEKTVKVESEVVIRFNSVVVGQARFTISDCKSPIRDIRWLAYPMPLIHETIE